VFFTTLQDESRNNKRFGSLPGYPPIKTTPNRNKGLNLVATQIFFIFTPKFGEDFQFDEHIFQMGRVLLRISFPTNKSLLNPCFCWGFLMGVVLMEGHSKERKLSNGSILGIFSQFVPLLSPQVRVPQNTNKGNV